MTRGMVRFLAAAVVSGTLLGAGVWAGAQSVTNLNYAHNPSGHAPLSGLLSFTTDPPAVATLHIDDGEHQSQVTPSAAYGTEHGLLVLGLRPGKVHSIWVTLKDKKGNESLSKKIEIATEPLPDDFPPIELKVSRPRRMEPGYTLVPFFRWAGAAPDEKFGLVMALDAHGDVVWVYHTDHTIGDLVPTGHGTFTYQVGRNGVMNEVDMLGNIVRRWHSTRVPKDVPDDSIPVDTDIFHHDHQVLANGNFLMLSTEVRDFEDYPASEAKPDAPPRDAQVIGDVIVEFRPDGTKLREYNVFDLLDPYRIGYGSLGTGFYSQAYKDVLERPAKDWTHTNSIFYDADHDAAVLSSYHQDVVYKVDFKTGGLVWLLGTHDGWKEPWQEYLLTPKGDDFLWNSHQHAAKITPQGTILLFDNGTLRARPFEEKMKAVDSWSRAVEFRIDEEKMEVEQVWSYGGPDDEIFFSPFISEVDWLPKKGNVLITDGGRMRGKDGKPSASVFGGHHFARVIEVTHETPANKVFEVVIDDPEMGWAVYRSERIASLYP